ncbi:MAG: multiheme c-type cytochrome [Acidobacteriota bacterium]
MTMLAAIILSFFLAAGGAENLPVCIGCHKDVTPGIVDDWQQSKHAENSITCDTCHGDKHQSVSDVSNVALPTPATCGICHERQVTQFNGGKHALAWVAMKAMPTTHALPVSLREGLKGCGGCHKIGAKTAAEIQELQKAGAGFGRASCDACHTRHLFSVKEAREPQACQTCHMGFDHPQWEMYSSSKHGVRYLLKQNKVLPESVAAPTCQTCHMPLGDHGVMTAWGFLAVRLPMPEDKQWADDRATILRALGVLGPDGKPTGRLDIVRAGKVARLSQEEWQAQQDRMINICHQCHSLNFAQGELAKGDQMIQEADRLMAEAIRIVGALYADGVLQKPAAYEQPFPDLLTFHDAPTPIEQRLFVMHLEHRMRAFQGTFHNNPDYALWYGWSEMKRDLTEIRAMAAEMRKAAGASGP